MNKKMTRIRVTLNSVKGLNYPKFYKKVWIECMKIPEGETRTYKQIAEKIGHPKAYRAVGSALAGNPFAPFIPCHRVIRSDGKLGNYSGPGGIKKKNLY